MMGVMLDDAKKRLKKPPMQEEPCKLSFNLDLHIFARNKMREYVDEGDARCVPALVLNQEPPAHQPSV